MVSFATLFFPIPIRNECGPDSARQWNRSHKLAFVERSQGTQKRASDIEGLEIGDALLRQIPVQLDKIIFEPAGLRRLKYLRPIKAVLTDGQLPYAVWVVRVHALNMHGGKSAGVFVEILDRVADGRH